MCFINSTFGFIFPYPLSTSSSLFPSKDWGNWGMWMDPEASGNSWLDLNALNVECSSLFHIFVRQSIFALLYKLRCVLGAISFGCLRPLQTSWPPHSSSSAFCLLPLYLGIGKSWLCKAVGLPELVSGSKFCLVFDLDHLILLVYSSEKWVSR